MVIEKTYYKQVRAIEWTGEKIVLNYLKDMYGEEFKCWDTEKGLRISHINTQGDYWADLGDYLVNEGHGWFVSVKTQFESQYRKPNN